MVSTHVALPDGVGLTYADLVEIFGESTDGRRYELLDGALVVTPSPTTRHQLVCTELIQVLHRFAKEHDLGKVFAGPVDVIFSDRRVCVPDIVFVARAHLERISKRGIEGPPDLVVEILSPGTAARDHGFKRELYGQQGVLEYWIVDPSAEVLKRHLLVDSALQLDRTLGHDDTLTTPLFPGLAIQIATLFEA